MTGRETFATPRAAEFFDRKALQAQTGQPAHKFAAVLVKELLDNALDAAETAGESPQVTLETVHDDDRLTIRVSDNGPGMPPELIDRVLDFSVLVSDKSAYRSPTRGAQGNALKTVLGIPYALGGTGPVAISSQGVRQEITAGIDPAGEPRIEHVPTEIDAGPGTTVDVTVPVDDSYFDQYQEIDTHWWARACALFNPHADVAYLANNADLEDRTSYKPSAPDGWRKPLPTDPTSAHWYDETSLARLVFALIGKARRGGRDLPIGEFVRSFTGLSGSAKAKTVCASLPKITHLSGFEDNPAAVGTLLAAMQAESRVPKPILLGKVDAEHYRERFNDWYGVKRFWFSHKTVEGAVPWVIEVAVAETHQPGQIFYATNYSPAFSDRLDRTYLAADDVRTTGADSFLGEVDALPGRERNRAVAIHLITPAAEFLDKGKTTLSLPSGDAVKDVVAAALKAATKDLHAEQKRRERDARAKARPAPSPKADRVSLRDAVFEVMAEAVEKESDGGRLPFPVRNLFYRVPLIQQFGLNADDLKYGYFSQTLVVDYQREHGPISGMYRDPRGTLHEPHTGKTVRLGTREVAAYEFPEHTFNKILYIEKEGLEPVITAAKLAERYDMAIAYGKGQPAEVLS